MLTTVASTSKIIEIPVRSYVKKVLMSKKVWVKKTDDGRVVLKTNYNTLLGKAVYNMIADLPEELGFPESLPMDKISIELPHRVAIYYTRYGLWKVFELGVYYERVVQDMMLQHIAAQVRCNRSISKAIADFMAMYGIEDIEYESRTAEQLWFKWKMHFPIR